MKLIYCPECLDMKKLRMLELRECACGKAWGYYLEDDLTAEIGGSAIPIAIGNDDFRDAIDARPKLGRGSAFSGRVLPESHAHVRYPGAPQESITPDHS
jgi:hypothetical protein